MTIIYISMMFYENYALLYFVSNYWKGNPHNSDCKWEYLVDGMIEVNRKSCFNHDMLTERKPL